MITISYSLLLPEKDADGHTGKIEVLPQLIFKIIFVWFFNIIRKIAEKSK